MGNSNTDRDILRQLASAVAEIAALPVHRQTIAEWTRLNGLGQGRAMLSIWADQVPWNELNVDGELTVLAQDPLAKHVEWSLRATLYQWRHFPGDMVVEGVFPLRPVFRHDGFGIDTVDETSALDTTNDIVGHKYLPQFTGEADLAQIRTPSVIYDVQATEEREARVREWIGDILPVERRGITEFGPGMVDELFTWWGLEQAMEDLVDRPELFHEGMRRFTEAHLGLLDQYEALGLIHTGSGNHKTGQGGLAYSDELRQGVPAPVTTRDIWGSARAQIFVSVSPAMHEEFALRYERRLLERFALTYYGCCEPMDTKVDILRSIPNLRKISMSPWIEPVRAAAALGSDYVFSWKPNPAIFVDGAWSLERAEAEVRDTLEKTRGCIVEIILKDVSTVCYHPERLWEWARMVERVVRG